MNDVILINLEFGLYMVFLLIGATALFGGEIRNRWILFLNCVGFVGITLSGSLEVDVAGFIGGISLIVSYMLAVRFASEHRHIKKVCVLLILMYLQELFDMVLSAVVFPLKERIAEREWATIQCLWEVCVIIMIWWLYSRYKEKVSGIKFKKMQVRELFLYLYLYHLKLLC